MVGGTALVREAEGEEDADLIKTENLAATTEYSQTPRYPSIGRHQVTWIGSEYQVHYSHEVSTLLGFKPVLSVSLLGLLQFYGSAAKQVVATHLLETS